MSTAIGALYAILSANASQFANDMKKAKQAVNDNVNGMQKALWTFSASSEKVTKGIIGLKSAAIALGVGGLAYAEKAALDYAGALDDMSQQLGIGVEALQELQYAAKFSGVEASDLNGALEKLNKNIGLAAGGNKAAQQSFANLGINIKDTNGHIKTSDEVFKNVADRIAKIKSPAVQAAAATDLMGKSAGSLVQFLGKGSASMVALAAEAHNLGVILSAETIAKAAEAGDQFDQLSFILKAHTTAALLELVPAVKALDNLAASNGFIKFLSLAGTTLKYLVDGLQIMAYTTSQLVDLTIPVGVMAQNIRDFAASLNETTPAAGKAGKAAEDLGVSFADAGFDIKKALSQDNVDLRGINEMITTYKLAGDGIDALKDRLEVESDAVKNNIDITSVMGKQWYDAEIRLKSQQRVLTDVAKLYDDTRTPLEAYNMEVAKLNEYLADGAISQETYNRAMKTVGETYTEAQDKLKGLAGIGGDVKSAFSDWTESAILGTESLTDSVKALGEALIKAVFQRTIGNAVGDSLSGALSSIGKSDFFSSIGSSLSGVFGGGKAVGGPVVPTSSYLVGEHGPELFSPAGAGVITPNDKMGGNTYQIDARGADMAAVQRLERSLIQLAGPGVVERRIADATRRGKI